MDSSTENDLRMNSQKKKMNFLETDFEIVFFAVEAKITVLVKNNDFSQERAYCIKKSIFKLSKRHVCFKKGFSGANWPFFDNFHE